MKYFIFLLIIFNINTYSQELDTATATRTNKLPFDLSEYLGWHYSYSIGETDEKPYLSVGNFKRAQLSKAYSKRWDNDTIPFNYLPLDLKSKQFQLYIASCFLKDENIPSMIYRIVTVNSNDEIVDGITVYSWISGQKNTYIPESFYISEDLKVTLRQDTYDDNDVLVSSKVIKIYKIKEKGEFHEIK